MPYVDYSFDFPLSDEEGREYGEITDVEASVLYGNVAGEYVWHVNAADITVQAEVRAKDGVVHYEPTAPKQYLAEEIAQWLMTDRIQRQNIEEAINNDIRAPRPMRRD